MEQQRERARAWWAGRRGRRRVAGATAVPSLLALGVVVALVAIGPGATAAGALDVGDGPVIVEDSPTDDIPGTGEGDGGPGRDEDGEDRGGFLDWLDRAVENIGDWVGDLFDGPDDGDDPGGTGTGTGTGTGDDDGDGDGEPIPDGTEDTPPPTDPSPGGGSDTPSPLCDRLWSDYAVAVAMSEAADTPHEENIASGYLWGIAKALIDNGCM